MLHLLLAIAVGLTGCASASLRQKQDEFDKELQEIRRSHALTTQRIRELDRLNQTTFLIQDGIEQLGLEVERLNQVLSDTQTQMKVVQAALFDVNPDPSGAGGFADDAPRSVKKAPATTSKPSEVAKVSAKNGAVESNDGGDDRSLYQRAYEAMQAGKTDEAVATFGKLLERFPTSDLADNAHYWLGELFLGLGDQGSAGTHFNKIIEEYPNGNKVPDAFYKLGTMAQEQGNCAVASTWYRKVQEQFPWAGVSDKVAAKLAECNANP